MEKKYEDDMKGLSDHADELERRNEVERERRRVLNDQLRRKELTPEERDNVVQEIEDTDERINERNEEIEGTSLRSKFKIRIKEIKIKIKEIFKEHGFSVTAILLSVSAIVVTIVTNSLSAVSKMMGGFANGLKNISKKLLNILPGMIGAIASFIFRTAGEVVGFLGKNVWLLIVAIVVYFFEKLKKKNR